MQPLHFCGVTAVRHGGYTKCPRPTVVTAAMHTGWDDTSGMTVAAIVLEAHRRLSEHAAGSRAERLKMYLSECIWPTEMENLHKQMVLAPVYTSLAN